MDYSQTKFQLGDWQVDPIRNVLAKDGQDQKIEKLLVRLLIVLADHESLGVSKETLLANVWQGKVVSDDTISVAISKLRSALGCRARQPIYIETITGFGFRLLQTPTHLASNNDEYHDDTSLAPEAQPSTPKETEKPKSYWSVLTLAIVLFLSVGGLYAYKAVQTAEHIDKVQLQENPRYARAQFLIKRNSGLSDLQEAEGLLRGLAESMPNNPHVFNALASALFEQRWWQPFSSVAPKLEPIAKKVLELDPEYASAVEMLGAIYLMVHRDLYQAEQYVMQSVALEPANIHFRMGYADILVALGKFDSALHQTKVIQTLDPSQYAWPQLISLHLMAEDYDAAQNELAKFFDIDPDSKVYHKTALQLYEGMGDEQKAFHHYLTRFRLEGYTDEEIAGATAAFESGGLKQLNSWLANVQQEQRSVGQHTPPISTARYHVAAGEYSKALDALELADQQDHSGLLYLKADPKYKPLRGMPRFEKLVNKYKRTGG